jgi:hypothetical protein
MQGDSASGRDSSSGLIAWRAACYSFLHRPIQGVGHRCLKAENEGGKAVTISTNAEGNANAVQKAVSHDYEAERRLWTAVLMQAVQEWRSDRMRAKREAEAFLFHNEKDFQIVCAGAGMDPSALRSQLLRLCRVSGTAAMPQPQVA